MCVWRTKSWKKETSLKPTSKSTLTLVHKSHQLAPHDKHKDQQTTKKDIVFNGRMNSEMVWNTILEAFGIDSFVL